MFLASSFLQCRPVPFSTQAASSFITPRLFRTSINRSLRQTNIKYASPSLSPSPPRWKGLGTKSVILKVVTAPLDGVALTIEKLFTSRSRLIRFATKLFIFSFVCTAIYKGIHDLSKLRKSPFRWIAVSGTALPCVSIVLFIELAKRSKLHKSPPPWMRLASSFFICVVLPILGFTMFDIYGEHYSATSKHPPSVKKNLDNPISYQHEVLPQGYIRLIYVDPGKPEDPIELKMYSALFRPGDRTEWLPAKYVPQYEALSYTWDEDEKKDKMHAITYNLVPLQVISTIYISS